jgi:hypothetical protein
MSYLQILEHGAPRHWTTKRYVVQAQGGLPLGVIKWYGAWRKYVFFPDYDTLFDTNCLLEIAAHCEQVTKEHRERAVD